MRIMLYLISKLFDFLVWSWFRGEKSLIWKYPGGQKPCKISLQLSKIRSILFVPWIYQLTQFFISECPPSQVNYSSKRITISNHVHFAKSNGESTFQEEVLSVRKLTVGCLSSLNLQTFGKPMTVTTCTKSMVNAILQIFTAQKTSRH